MLLISVVHQLQKMKSPQTKIQVSRRQELLFRGRYMIHP